MPASFPVAARVVRMVVRVADRVLIAMGQLPLDPVPVVASGVQAGAQQMAETVASLAPLVTH